MGNNSLPNVYGLVSRYRLQKHVSNWINLNLTIFSRGVQTLWLEV